MRDGESFVETCPECGERARFTEVELVEKVGVFFVDLLGDSKRVFRCGACGETFDLKDDGRGDRGRAAPREQLSSGPSAAELAEQRRAADAERRAADERKAVRIEDELAELKKRMGR